MSTYSRQLALDQSGEIARTELRIGITLTRGLADAGQRVQWRLDFSPIETTTTASDDFRFAKNNRVQICLDLISA
jgi:hypothetical protein